MEFAISQASLTFAPGPGPGFRVRHLIAEAIREVGEFDDWVSEHGFEAVAKERLRIASGLIFELRDRMSEVYETSPHCNEQEAFNAASHAVVAVVQRCDSVLSEYEEPAAVLGGASPTFGLRAIGQLEYAQRKLANAAAREVAFRPLLNLLMGSPSEPEPLPTPPAELHPALDASTPEARNCVDDQDEQSTVPIQSSGQARIAKRMSNAEAEGLITRYRHENMTAYIAFRKRLDGARNDEEIKSCKNAARLVFGRNVIAAKTGVPGASVSNTQAYREIAAHLELDPVRSSTEPTGARVPIEEGINALAEKVGDTTDHEVRMRELIAIANRRLPPAHAAAIADSLALGHQTPDEVGAMLDTLKPDPV